MSRAFYENKSEGRQMDRGLREMMQVRDEMRETERWVRCKPGLTRQLQPVSTVTVGAGIYAIIVTL